MVLSGLRGVGKTVLLNELARAARSAGWIVCTLEGQTGDKDGRDFASALGRALTEALREIAPPSWGERLKAAARTLKSFALTVDPSGAVSLGIDVDPSHRANSGRMDTDLPELANDLATAAVERNTGVAIFVDEMQDVGTPALAGLITAAHLAGQRELPFYVIGAGLPSLPRVLAEAKSYAERLFEFRDIGRLDEASARDALVRPVVAEGANWDEPALGAVLQGSGGYPYFLQEFGSAAWTVASGPSISLHEARTAILLGTAQLDSGFFRSRWDRATPAERDYLVAMAPDGGIPSQSGEVARRLNRLATALGPARASLINKGLLFAPEHGQIAYTVPGMADFIGRQKT
jgi:hypothetical protein